MRRQPAWLVNHLPGPPAGQLRRATWLPLGWDGGGPPPMCPGPGLNMAEQLFNPSTSGLVYFVGAMQLFTYASIVPIMNGESTDARSFGLFIARAERWNGAVGHVGVPVFGHYRGYLRRAHLPLNCIDSVTY